MDASTEAGIARLKEEQEKSLSACDQRIKQWKEFENDYKTLHNFLGTVGHKLQHEVMVPFGKLAFMPGQLVNTNNVLVLLGDNWFVERSTKEAQGIVDRRITACQETLNGLEQEKEQAEGWIKHTETALGGDEGMKEIIEEYDPVRDVSWREKRRQRVSHLKDDQSAKAGCSRTKSSRVRWEDQDQIQPAVISFTHSSKSPPDTLEFQANTKLEMVGSPGDIWNIFGSPDVEKKSILKLTKSSPASEQKPIHVVNNERQQPAMSPEFLEDNSHSGQLLELSNQAFTGTIVEKTSTDVLEIEIEAPSRPISRFKAQRSKK